MTRSKILIEKQARPNGGLFHYFYCPACECDHAFIIGGGRGWSWNGDREKPTVTPSVRIFEPASTDPEWPSAEETLCHLFIKDGNIEFCGDCPHDLKGQTVPMADWPENYGTEGLE